MTQIEYPDVDTCPNPTIADTLTPPTVRNPGDFERWPMTLEQAIRIALSQDQVIRDLGGQVVQAPQTVRTEYDPALQELNPLTGPEAALSAFDANIVGSAFLDKNDRAFNNFFASGGIMPPPNTAATVVLDTANSVVELNKIAPTGTRFALRTITSYNKQTPFAANFQLFQSYWDTSLEGEVRHPLGLGAGIEFNRIAGPSGVIGQYNGVLVARLNTDTAISDFEIAVRNLTRNVERTYWELYFSYRDLDAKVQGLNYALKTWELVKDQIAVGTSDSEREALARSQYYLAQAAVEDAFAGRTATPGGLLNAERRLRLLLGLPSADGRLILPADEPAQVDVHFDWREVLAESLTRRAELRRQQWQIKRRELELIASRNFTRPRVDIVGTYRWNGFGDNLFGDYDSPNGGALDNLFGGDLQGWRMGLEVQNPVGNRVGHLAVRHAQFLLAREQRIYEAQEQQVAYESASAFGELDRAYLLTRTRFNESTASYEQARAIYDKYVLGPDQPAVLLENVLSAQSRAVQATSDYFRALVDYNLAIMELHYAKGSLLDYHSVVMTEGPWSSRARARSGLNTEHLAPTLRHKQVDVAPYTQGAYPQEQLPVDESQQERLTPPQELPQPLDRAPSNPDSPTQSAGSQSRAQGLLAAGRSAARR